MLVSHARELSECSGEVREFDQFHGAIFPLNLAFISRNVFSDTFFFAGNFIGSSYMVLFILFYRQTYRANAAKAKKRE
jgi:hypothetical protein